MEVRSGSLSGVSDLFRNINIRANRTAVALRAKRHFELPAVSLTCAKN